MDERRLLRAHTMESLGPQAFPLGGPSYKPVPAKELINPPYLLIARVYVLWSESDHQPIGSAWMMQGGVLVTCAHVCPPGHDYIVRFPEGAALPVTPVHYKEYRNRPVDRGDLAVLTNIPSTAEGLPLKLDGARGKIEAAGYPAYESEMVRHDGTAQCHDGWLIHSAHTARGQSGAPILQAGEVVGMQLGPARVINRYLPGTYSGEPPGANAGLVFTKRHAAFLETYVQPSEEI